jgi:GTP-binding protein
VDHVSVLLARRSIRRADVAILLLDAGEGFREMDATIAGYVKDAGRGVVVAVNKWDLARERSLAMRAFEASVREGLKFLSHAPVVFVSASTGKGLQALWAAVDRVQAASRTRIATGPLNRLLAEAARSHPQKAAKGAAPVKILYASQIGISPPTFVLAINHPVDLHFSYKRYLENKLRAKFGFEGAPIVLLVRARAH